MRCPRFAFLSVTWVALLGAGLTMLGDGCSSDAPVAAGTGNAAEAGAGNGDAGDAALANETGATDAGATVDAACAATKVLPSTGETCVGFGAGTGCDTTCGLPKYGYVCFNGGPPGFAGCVQASSTGSFGDTYCCPDNKCVPQPDQDKQCTSAGKPHRYQCPPDGASGNVTPPSGCADGGLGGSALEHFYCCP
jgi:hypothetical protein